MKICEILDIAVIEILKRSRFLSSIFLGILKLQRVAELLAECIGLIHLADA